MTTWSHEVTWPIKNKISHILQGLWPKNLPGYWLWLGDLTRDVARAFDYVVIWSRVPISKRNISYSTKLLTHKLKRAVAYNEHNSPMMSHDPLTTWPLRSRDKLKALYLLSKKSMIRKLCKVVPYDEVKSNIMSRDPQTT